MAVVSIVKIWNGQNGQAGSDSKVQYTAAFRILTDDKNDGPNVIISYAQGTANLALGSPYEFGNDANYDAFLKSLSPRRVDGSQKVWELVCTWEVGSGDEKKNNSDDKGKPTNDPYKWHDELDVSHENFTKAAERATYIKGFSGKADAICLAFPVRPACNSALVPYDPPLEADDSRQVIRIGKWLKKFPFDDVEKYVGSINSGEYNISKPDYGFSKKCPKQTLKMRSISGSFQFQNNVPIWKVSYELAYKSSTWLDEVVDRGLEARAHPGDDDGLGGTITAFDDNQQPLPVVKGIPLVRRITDARGTPITDPILFDGDGQPLKAGGKPVYSTWCVPVSRDWSALKL